MDPERLSFTGFHVGSGKQSVRKKILFREFLFCEERELKTFCELGKEQWAVGGCVFAIDFPCNGGLQTVVVGIKPFNAQSRSGKALEVHACIWQWSGVKRGITMVNKSGKLQFAREFSG
jgi:hypothetical protein